MGVGTGGGAGCCGVGLGERVWILVKSRFGDDDGTRLCYAIIPQAHRVDIEHRLLWPLSVSDLWPRWNHQLQCY